MSKRRGRPRRRWGLVLRFAAIALVAFVATAGGLSFLLSRRALDRQRRAAETHAVYVAKFVLGGELTSKDLSLPVRGIRYTDLLGFVKAEVLQPPLVLATVWRADGTALFSSERRVQGGKYSPSAGLRAAFIQGRSMNSVTFNVDKGQLFVPQLPEQFLDTYVPLFDPEAKPGSKPVAVAEVYTDYAAVTTQARAVTTKDALMVGQVLGILYLILIPVAWSIVETVENQDQRMELLLSRERSTQFERRRLLDRMLKATEEERSRLAAELHDGPVQRLARLGFGLERVRSRQKQGDVIGAERMLHDMQSSVFQEVKELRAMMSRLRPPVLDQRGLEDALRDRAEAIKADTGLECTVQAKLDGRLAPTLETVLYRVSQEALQNVVKHARAKHARVMLGRDDGAVVLEVQDDGVGFQPAETKSEGSDHFGMLAMRERVEMIGGTCEVTSVPGKGTRVRVVLPWQGSQ